MSRRSRGCQPCRARKLKCNEGRPSCRLCIRRDEICHGYRDEASLVFVDENARIARKVVTRRASTNSLFAHQSASDTSSIDSFPSRTNSQRLSTVDRFSFISYSRSLSQDSVPTEDQVISQFFERFVMYPANNSSSPGFLEYLPCLFEEVQTEGRIALRCAVRAVSYASLLNEENKMTLLPQAQKCYGKALSALGETLKDREAAVSDYTLMTIVVLDMFESMFVERSNLSGSHTIGMAQILRLRGPDQTYSPRGWSLFRLAHHRLQNQQLAYRRSPMPESENWIRALSDDLPEVHIERDSFEMSKICEEARNLRARVVDPDISFDQTLDIISRMHVLDRKVSSWRVGPSWDYKVLARNQLPEQAVNPATCPEIIQLHRDVWIAYEWNYHRTARLVMHEHLLECLNRPVSSLSKQSDILRASLISCQTTSVNTIVSLINDILATVPQSLGEIDQDGNAFSGTTKPKAIGGYFLLWPIYIVKSTRSATLEQKTMAEAVFERIRECTGMKYALGDSSKI